MCKSEQLFKDLKDVKELIKKVPEIEDLGTCNMDAPAIRVRGIKKEDVVKIAQAAGFSAYIWDFTGRVVIDFGGPYQGFMRTKIARTLTEEFRKRGYDAMVFSQMD